MNLQAKSAVLLASGLVGGGCFTAVGEPVVHTHTDGGGPIDAGPMECTIDGVFYADGRLDPLNPCLVCNVAHSSSQWSAAVDGIACGPNQRCFGGVCAHACQLDGGFVGAGRPDPTGCRVCSTDGFWTQSTDGKTCSFDVPSTVPLFCFNGVCSRGCYIGGIFYDPSARNPENSCEWCGIHSGNGWSNAEYGLSCADGGVCDFDGHCGPPACAITSASGSIEDFPGRSSNPADPSLCCNANVSPFDWSQRLVLSQTLDTGGPVIAIATGDLNGDSWLDLVAITGDPMNLTLSVFLNQAGDLQPTYAFGLASGALAIAALDVNGDGFADVLVGYVGDPYLTIMTSMGDGTFSFTSSYYVNSFADRGQIQGADFNSDGLIDVVFGIERVLYFQNGGDGGLLTPATITDLPRGWEERSALADLNGDRSPDIALAEGNGSDLTVASVLGNGSGGFRNPAAVVRVDLTPNTLQDMAVADLDGDGFRDMALTTYAGLPSSAPGVGYLLGHGDGTFGATHWAPTIFDPIGNIEGLTTADLAGDGTSRVLFAVFTNDDNLKRWRLFSWDIVSGALRPVLKDGAARWPVVADFNDDGAQDVAGLGDPALPSPGIAIYLNGCP